MRAPPIAPINAASVNAITLTLVLAAGLMVAGGRAIAAAELPSDGPPDLPAGWSLGTLPGARPEVSLQVLQRPALAPPTRYSVVVLPGSGCTGWLPVAARYFAGLLHADLLVLHKPGVNMNAGLAADCSAAFVHNDNLSAWRDHARSALRAHYASRPRPAATAPALPVLLVGISEGAELLPSLAPEVPGLAAMVMVSAPGLDPRETGALQARRLGQWQAWRALERAQASSASGDILLEGRTLSYWRDFWHWRLAQPLLQAPWPLLRVWGDADELVPLEAYQRFLLPSQARAAPFCDVRLPNADHALQSERAVPPRPAAQHRDGLQLVWARLEAWARNPVAGFCEQTATK